MTVRLAADSGDAVVEVIGGFNPTPLEAIVDYIPTFTEISVTLGIWAIGLLVLTMLLKVAIAVKTQEA